MRTTTCRAVACDEDTWTHSHPALCVLCFANPDNIHDEDPDNEAGDDARDALEETDEEEDV